MNASIENNYKQYVERNKLYKSFGYDCEKERSFVIEKTEPIHGKILEIGTGKGHFALELAKYGYGFISIDLSEEEQNMALLNLRYFGLQDQVELLIRDALDTKFKDQSFDVIFSVNLLHHIDRPYKAINEWIRLISENGKIIVSDFSKEGFELIDKVHKSEGREHYKSLISLNQIERFLVDKGFNIQKFNTRYQEMILVTR
jgi:ubiquinone/menaquinone biosynthesis C-methylase UbiE